jgi:cytochrome c oxidase cbb3-type subunit III
MDARGALWTGLVALACVAGGALECGQPFLTAEQRHGAELYGRMCAVCHGPSGEGYAADHAPALAHPDFLGSVSEGLLRSAITYGRTDTTMAAWSAERGGPLAPEDVDALITFMRSWHAGPPITLNETPLQGNAARGQILFRRECVTCHGERGQAGPNVRIGNPELLQEASNGFLRHAIAWGRHGTIMPGFGEKLASEGVEDLVAALRSFARPPPPKPPPSPVRPPPMPLGAVPLNPKGPEPVGFEVHPKTTKVDVVQGQLKRGARMAILDARTPSEYTREHIAGAVSVPFYDPSPYLDKLPKDAWLVCYCSCPHAESRTLASKLLEAGFPKVTVLDEGLGVWRARKYGTREGLDP